MEQTMEGVTLEATLGGATLRALRFTPYRMDPVAFALRVARGDVRARILDDPWSSGSGPVRQP